MTAIFKFKSSGTKYMSLLFGLLVLFIFFFSECKPKQSSDINEPNTPPIVITKDLTEEKVIEIAKNLLNQKRKTIPIQMHYWKTVMTKVPCTQYDVDAGISCSEPAAGAPYGYKNVAQQVWECCEQRDFPIYNEIGKWTAEYSESEDRWTVTDEFNADDLKYYFVWLVDDNNSQITEQGLKQ